MGAHSDLATNRLLSLDNKLCFSVSSSGVKWKKCKRNGAIVRFGSVHAKRSFRLAISYCAAFTCLLFHSFYSRSVLALLRLFSHLQECIMCVSAFVFFLLVRWKIVNSATYTFHLVHMTKDETNTENGSFFFSFCVVVFTVRCQMCGGCLIFFNLNLFNVRWAWVCSNICDFEFSALVLRSLAKW